MYLLGICRVCIIYCRCPYSNELTLKELSIHPLADGSYEKIVLQRWSLLEEVLSRPISRLLKLFLSPNGLQQ